MDEAVLAAQQLAGNAAVGSLLRGVTADPGADASGVLPELVTAPRLTVRLPVAIIGVLTAEPRTSGVQESHPTTVGLDWTAGTGDRSVGPAPITTGAHGTKLTGRLHGFSPLRWDVPMSGRVGVLASEIALRLRIGRVDLARGGNEARITLADDVVSLTIDFAGGRIRLVGELGDRGDAPADWDAEVELDHRRCARLLAPGRGTADGGSRGGFAAAVDQPQADPPEAGSGRAWTPGGPGGSGGADGATTGENATAPR